jgi:colicin import membrane protein
VSTLGLPPRPDHPQDGGRGLLLALGAHGLLVWALAYGVHWRSSETGAVAEAELWAAVPQAAAPRAEVPPPPPPPAPAPQAKTAEPVEPPKVDREAEIAEQRERRRQEQLRKDAEQTEQQQRLREQRRIKELEKLEAKRKQDEAQKAEQKAEREAKLDAERREKQRQDNLRRIQGLAGGSGAPESSGAAAQSSGPSAGYAAKVMERVRPNLRPPKTFPRELVTDIAVVCAADGQIIAATIKRSSGNPEWDEWARRAVLASVSMPRDTNGRVPPDLVIGIRPID